LHAVTIAAGDGIIKDLKTTTVVVSPVFTELAAITEHGNRCWEDILPTAASERALEQHIRTWLDGRLWWQRDREIERARARL